MALTRRAFLAASAGAGATALLAACGGTATAPATSPAAAPASGSAKPSAAAALKLPTYTPVQGPKPDFAASADGVVPAGYSNFPKDLVKTVPQAPGKGGTVQLYTYASQAAPTPFDSNPAWQQVNKELNVTLQVPIIDLVDYNTKLQTTIASGQLPDVLSVNVSGQILPGELDFFNSQCADLTPFLAGDAVKAYPNLANFPSLAWKSCIFNNKIFALPRVVASVGTAMYVQQNVLDDAGIKGFGNKDDFLKAMKQLTKPGTFYGLGGVQSTTMNYFLMCFRAPNNWRNDGGKLTKDWETPEYKDTVTFLRSLWDAGTVSPDTPTMVAQSGAAAFYGGKFLMYPSDYFVYQIVWDRIRTSGNKTFKPRVLQPFGADGGKSEQFQTAGVSQISILKKASDDRIKELLSILNYIAAPFGSQENMLLANGVKDTDYQFDSAGNPVPTQRGPMDIHVPWLNVVSPPAVFYYAPDPSFAGVANQDATASHANNPIVDPTIGLYSPTLLNKAAVINKALTDGVNQILFGRADVSTLDQLVKDWKAAGGDQIRTELQDALQQSAIS
ncbi:MAG: extracellular solute-binding protein [Chloroflexi bacterium]|nr:extracellular solute-binding protein [Chloroflexota bacterium]